MAFRYVPDGSRLRPLVESHVREVYGRTHGAVVRNFPRLMVADVDANGQIHCAAGLRRAGDGFFSECYVDMPLEIELSRLTGHSVGRTLTLDRLLGNVCKVLGSNGIAKLINSTSKALHLERVKFHINTGDMMRIYVTK